ncbi:MAG: hypothetical protein QF881_09065, partial [Acidimicrobiales bacterium]|nr:hypothetical protein [Acidimicrobiales bacterium]
MGFVAIGQAVAVAVLKGGISHGGDLRAVIDAVAVGVRDCGIASVGIDFGTVIETVAVAVGHIRIGSVVLLLQISGPVAVGIARSVRGSQVTGLNGST